MRIRIAVFFIVCSLFLVMPSAAQVGVPVPTAQGGIGVPIPMYSQPQPTITMFPTNTPVPTWTPLPTYSPPIFTIQLWYETWIYDCPSFNCMHEPAISTQPGDQCWPLVPARAATYRFFQIQGNCWYSGRYVDRTQVTVK